MQDQTIPPGLCQCGCGTRTVIADMTRTARGITKGQPVRFVHGHSRRARNVPACGYVEEDRGYLTPCWVWKLSTNDDGYSRTPRGGQLVPAHIVMWESRNGPTPPGLQLDHLCRVRACVNPDHLEPVTNAVNSQRGRNAKLSPEIVLAILASDEPIRVMALRYGVHQDSIRNVQLGHTWANVRADAERTREVEPAAEAPFAESR